MVRRRWLYADYTKDSRHLADLWKYLHVLVAWAVLGLNAAGFAIAYQHFPTAKKYTGG